MLEIRPRVLAFTRKTMKRALLCAGALVPTLAGQSPQASPKEVPQQTATPPQPLGTSQRRTGSTQTLLAPENAWFFIRVPLANGKLPSLLTQLPGELDQLASSWRTWARKAFGASPENWTGVEISLLHSSEGEYPEGTLLLSFVTPHGSGIQPTKIQKIPAPFAGEDQWAMARKDQRVWVSNHPKAIRYALRIQGEVAGRLFQDPDLASLVEKGAARPGEIIIFLRPLGIRNRLLQAPLGAGLRRILKSPIGRKGAILLRKKIQESQEEWTLLEGPQDQGNDPVQADISNDPKRIPQIDGARSWFWTSTSWERSIQGLSQWGKTPAPLFLLPTLGETLKGTLGDLENREWSASIGTGLLWLGPLPEKKGGGVLLPIRNPKAIKKNLQAAGARSQGPRKENHQAGEAKAHGSHLVWEGGRGKLEIDILGNFLLLATPGFDLGGLDLEGNSQDLSPNTLVAGSLSGRDWGIAGFPNSIDFKAQRTHRGAITIHLENGDGSLPLWSTLTQVLGKKQARDRLEPASEEDPELLDAILGTLSLETDPAKALAHITQAQKNKDLETLRAYALSEEEKIASRAIEALGTLKDRESAPLFEKGFAQDRPALVRKASAYGLSRLGGPKARKLLQAGLLDSDGLVRLYALKAQSPKHLDGKLHSALLQLVDTWTKDETADRSQALLLLHDQGDPSSLDSLALTPAGGSRFQQALVYTFQDLSPKLPTQEEVRVLRKAMRSRNIALQRYAIQRLGALGTPEAVATLREESKRLAGTPLAATIRTSLEANNAGPGIGALLGKAKAKAQFWFRSAKSWLRRQDPLTQKLLALSPIGLLLLLGAFWALRRRKKRREAEAEIQELLRPSEELGEETSPYGVSELENPEDSLQMEEEGEPYATSLYDRE